MKDVKSVGIDIAKNVFQLCGANRWGKPILTKRLKRKELVEWLSTHLEKNCKIYIESCGSAHYWARRFSLLGYEVKLIAPQLVKPFISGNKNDERDAAGILEAGMRPTMRYVPLKSIEQQDIQCLHRARALAVKQRTMYSNQIRGLLSEYGIIFPQGISQIRTHLVEALEDAKNGLTDFVRTIINDLYELFQTVDQLIKNYDRKVEALVKSQADCQRLMRLPGVGPLIASAFVMAVGNGSEFRRGREVSAWLGLTPKHKASGEKLWMQGMSKRGDVYLRTLIIQGCRAVLRYCTVKEDKRSRWIADKKVRLGYNKAAVALANKTVREMWAIVHKGELFQFSG